MGCSTRGWCGDDVVPDERMGLSLGPSTGHRRGCSFVREPSGHRWSDVAMGRTNPAKSLRIDATGRRERGTGTGHVSAR